MIHEFEVKIALKYYQEYIDSLQESEWEIEELQTRIEHAGGSVAKRPENPIDSGTLQINNMERMRKLVVERDRFQNNVRLADHFIGWCKDTDHHRDKSFIVDRFIIQRSIAWLADEYTIDRSMVFDKTNYLIKKYVDSLKVPTSRACQDDIIVL